MILLSDNDLTSSFDYFSNFTLLISYNLLYFNSSNLLIKKELVLAIKIHTERIVNMYFNSRILTLSLKTIYIKYMLFCFCL